MNYYTIRHRPQAETVAISLLRWQPGYIEQPKHNPPRFVRRSTTGCPRSQTTLSRVTCEYSRAP